MLAVHRKVASVVALNWDLEMAERSSLKVEMEKIALAYPDLAVLN